MSLGDAVPVEGMEIRIKHRHLALGRWRAQLFQANQTGLLNRATQSTQHHNQLFVILPSPSNRISCA